MSEPRRVAVHIERDARQVVLSVHDRESGNRATLAMRRRGAGALTAQLLLASGEGDDWSSECELTGNLEIHGP